MDSQLMKYPSKLADQSPCNVCETASLGCINDCKKVREWSGQCVNKLQEIEKFIELPKYDHQLMLELKELVEERKARRRVEHPAKSYLTETDVKIMQLVDRLF